MDKRSENDGSLKSLDLINQNKLLPNHHIYFTCFFSFSVSAHFLKLAILWSAMIQ